ncbi:MAG: NFACT RNA binding domain-containing protein [Candidatus Zixiibacteriota bacterium]
MAITGWHLVRLVEEARRDLVGTTLEATGFNPANGATLFHTGSRRGRLGIVIQVRGGGATFCWTADRSGTFPGEFAATERFNRSWRARITGIDLPRADRLIQFQLQKQTEDGLHELTLYAAWAGQSGNIWLVDTTTGQVLESLWESTANPVKSRFTLPKPPALFDWRQMTMPDYEALVVAHAGLPFDELLMKRFWGIDAAIADHLVSLVMGSVGEPDSPRGRWLRFEALLRGLRRAVDPETPVVVGDGKDGAPIVLPAPPDCEHDVFASLAAAMMHVFAVSGVESNRASRVAQLRAALDKRLGAIRKRVRDLEKAIAGGEEAAVIKRHADLLGAQRQAITRGAKMARVEDWESGETITIPLDPALSPQENIEAIYKQARKMASAAGHAQAERPGLTAEMERLEALRGRLDHQEIGDNQLEEIASALDLPPASLTSARPAQPRRLPYREFQLGKYTILVGRSSRDNDELTRKIARPGDLFFHADQVGGSHVILRRAGKSGEFPSEAIVGAAQIAAFFSKARHSTLVSVIYADARHVTKPRKAPPGLVRVSNEKSLMVRPGPPPGYHE